MKRHWSNVLTENFSYQSCRFVYLFDFMADHFRPAGFRFK